MADAAAFIFIDFDTVTFEGRNKVKAAKRRSNKKIPIIKKIILRISY